MITSKEKINIVGIGIFGSILVFFLIYTLMARFLAIFVINGLEQNITLFIVILGMLFISFVVSLLVSIWQGDYLNQQRLFGAALITFLVNILFIAAISYFFLYAKYPELFSGMSFFEMVIVFPTVLVLFSIYVLGHPIGLIILSIFSYYVFFLIFLEQFEV